ncbi:MAG: hypothetical protein J6J17_04230 [Bacilli bacterium]|nr:hypothetical protein [Bacilli bacterium]
MKENFELCEHIYEDAEMACYTIEELIKDLKDKNNKIKRLLEDILKEYTSYKEDAKKELDKNGMEIDEKGPVSKMMAGMGIKKEVKSDNSDSSIAQMLIEGISMGSLNTERKINDFDKDVNKDHIKFAKEFLKFQEKSISELKKYL